MRITTVPLLALFAIAAIAVTSCGGASADFADDQTADASTSPDAAAGDSVTAGDTPNVSDAINLEDSPPRPDGGPPDTMAPDAPVPTACTATSGCTSTEYCDGAACGAGVCRPRPPTSPTFDPVCGCDGITYWNQEVARAAGRSVVSVGSCAGTAVTCSSFGSCAAPANKCVVERTSCSGFESTGRCWSIPGDRVCPAGSKTVRTCGFTGGGTCLTRCEAILGGGSFAPDATCK